MLIIKVSEKTKVTLNDVQVLAHSRFSVFVDYMKTTSVYQIIEKSPKRDGNPVASFTVDSYNTIVSPKNEQIPGSWTCSKSRPRSWTWR